ncbi:tetratricopeptide repeat protein [soil metagenome]
MNCKKPANYLWLAIAAVFFAGSVPSRADALRDGQDAYKKGDYATSARDFETALAAKGPNAGLYYNLGMAQIKNGQRPEASLSMHRALLLDPRMVDAQVELSNLDRSQGVPATPPDWRARVAEKIPLAPLLIVGCVIAWLGAFLLLAAIFKRGRKAGPVLGAIVVLAIGKGLAAVAGLSDPRLTDRSAAVILGTDGATLLAAPADQSAVVSKLPAGAEVRLVGKSGEWTCCETPAGEKGWTTSKAIAPVVPKA